MTDCCGAFSRSLVPLLQNVQLQAHSFNVLLHLCSGGNQSADAEKRVFPEACHEVSLYIFPHGLLQCVAAAG